MNKDGINKKVDSKKEKSFSFQKSTFFVKNISKRRNLWYNIRSTMGKR